MVSLAGWIIPSQESEKTYNSVEPRAPVPLRLVVHLVLTRTELAEVLRGLRHDILEQLKRDPAERLSCVEAISSAQVTSAPSNPPPLHMQAASPVAQGPCRLIARGEETQRCNAASAGRAGRGRPTTFRRQLDRTDRPMHRTCLSLGHLPGQ